MQALLFLRLCAKGILNHWVVRAGHRAEKFIVLIVYVYSVWLLPIGIKIRWTNSMEKLLALSYMFGYLCLYLIFIFFISYWPHLIYIPHLTYIVTSWRQPNAPILLITTMALWRHAGYGRPVPHLICLFTSFLLALDFACSKIKCLSFCLSFCSKIKCLSFCLSCLLSNNCWAT